MQCFFPSRIGHINTDQTENGFEEIITQSTQIHVWQFKNAEIRCIFGWLCHHFSGKLKLVFNTFVILGTKSILFLILQLSSCSLRHIFGTDDPMYGVPAAFLASIAFANYPDTTVALYVFWKALQVNIDMLCLFVSFFCSILKFSLIHCFRLSDIV